MSARIIKSEAEYEAMLKRIEMLMDAAAGSPEEQELDVLGSMVEEYEKTHYSIDA